MLTPQGIARRLFNVPDGTAVEIHVSFDQPGLVRVIRTQSHGAHAHGYAIRW